MRVLEKYTGDKTYMFPNGGMGTPQAVKEKFPAVTAFTHVVETDESGEVMFALQNLSAMCTMHGVSQRLSENEKIAALSEILNAPDEEESSVSPEIRQAEALEAIAEGATAETTEIIDILLGEEGKA